MLSTPVLRFELEQLKHTIRSYLQDSNHDISQMIDETIEKTLSEEWVQTRIEEAVNECIKNAIDELSNNFQLKNLFKDAIIELISKKLNSEDVNKNED